MNELLNWAQVAVEVIAVSGGGYALSKYLIKAKSITRNEHIKSALEFASQAVLTAQQIFGGGLQQQQVAAADLKNRLDKSGIGDKFTEDQILAYIKSAYASNKADGKLDTVKPQSPLDVKPDANNDKLTSNQLIEGETEGV